MAVKKTTTRINFNVTEKQKKELQKRAKEADKNLTDYIISSTIEYDPNKEHSIEMLELDYKIKTLEFQLEQQSTIIEQLRQEKETLKQEYDEVNALYRQSNQALMWHSLPFYKKMFTKQLDNK